MLYLDTFHLPSEDQEWQFRMGVTRTCYQTMYPFFTLTPLQLERLDFAPVTILYGGNGSGKTTILNLIAEKLSLKRETPFNRSCFFDDYVKLCGATFENPVPAESRIIVSDDVFDYMLNVRSLNDGIDRERLELFEEHREARSTVFTLRSLADYDELKKRNSARRKTQSAFVREQLSPNIREQSNGESASFYFKQRLKEDALYLLDEPENSLSPEKQMALAKYIEDSVHYMDCQLVISTHSPFLLALRGAKIYDLDARPVDIKPWIALDNVRRYRAFFEDHRDEFERKE
ncbi:MAG: AAA family ATPase [Candidatus Pacebacteria bacterium]|nr:AAA family ATPase [Candidatus Paceibacterota bacterium]